MPVSKIKDQKSKIKNTSQKSKVKSEASHLERAKRVEGSVKQTAKPAVKTLTSVLSAPVFSLAGIEAGTLALPKEIFGQKVNKRLLAQAMRVYLTNQKTLLGFTKTRGEVVGSTVKIYRQKGTGKARHGAIRAPIFVGGGITFGPKPRKVRLDLPKKMKKAALIAALSSKAKDKEVLAIDGLEKASGKTKQAAAWLGKVKIKNALIVTEGKADNAVRAFRNIPEVVILSVNLINAYEVLKHRTLVITKEAVDKLVKGEQK